MSDGLKLSLFLPLPMKKIPMLRTVPLILCASVLLPHMPVAASSWDDLHRTATWTGMPANEAADPNAEVELFVVLQEAPLLPQLSRTRSLIKAGPKDGSYWNALAESLRVARARIDAAQEGFVIEARRSGLILEEKRRFTDLVNAVLIRARRADIAELRGIPGVEGVHENHRVWASLHQSVLLTGADRVWSLTDAGGNSATGHGMVVAVIDTGIDYTHADLGGCLGVDCKVVGGWDFVNDDADPMDDNFHGTHVAGIVAANGTVQGVAPDARLMALKVLDEHGSGSTADVVAAIEMAVNPDGDPLTQDGVDVMNLSLGTPMGSPTDPSSVALDNAVAQGVIAVVAAGNSGSDYYTIGSPANSEMAITVASSTKEGSISEFSSRGPLDDAGYLFVKPEITAPGSQINSTVLNQGHQSLDGTSMAAPHVAGGAVLLRQLHPAYSPLEIKSLLIHAAVSLEEDIYTEGAGRMDLARAAANANITVDTVMIHHGRIDNSVARWISPDKHLVFTNHGSAPVTLAFAFDRGSAPDGIASEHTSSLTLNPGESKTAYERMTVDNTKVSFPHTQTQVYQSALLVTGAGVDLRIPIVVHKNAMLSIDFESSAGAGGWGLVFSDDGALQKDFAIEHSTASTLTLPLVPGIYQGIFGFSASGQYVVMEDIEVPANGATIQVNSDQASHVIALPTYRRTDGEPVPLSDLAVNQKRLIIEHRATGRGFWELSRFSLLPGIYRFNDFSSDFAIKGMSLLEDRLAPFDDRQLYHSSFGYEGMSGSQDLQLGESAKSLRVHYDTGRLAAGISPFMYYVSIDPHLDMAATGVPLFDQPVFASPFSLTFHMRGVSDEVDTNPMRYLWLAYLDPAFNPVAASSVFRPSPEHSSLGGFYFLERGPDRGADFEAEVARAAQGTRGSSESSFGDSAIFWNAEFRYSANRNAALLSLPDGRETIYFSPFRDAYHNKRLDLDIPFEMHVDGAVSAEGLLDGGEFLPSVEVWGLRQPGALSTVEFFGETAFKLLGRAGVSRAHITNRTAETRGPYIKSLRVLDADGLPTDHVDPLSYASHRIELVAGDDIGLDTVQLELDTGSGWVPLSLTRTGEVHIAALPPLGAGTALGKLRITLRDADRASAGNTLVNTIVPAFIVDAGLFFDGFE